MSSNSLYCMPAGSKVTLSETGTNKGNILKYNGDNTFIYGSNSGTASSDSPKQYVNSKDLIRVSSVVVASNSPFKVRVRNAGDNYTVYMIKGQQPTKITFGPNTVAGNPALLATVKAGTSVIPLVRVSDAESDVDFSINFVYDSAED